MKDLCESLQDTYKVALYTLGGATSTQATAADRRRSAACLCLGFNANAKPCTSNFAIFAL